MTRTPPQTFFGTKDNLGFDHLRITTIAQPQDAGRCHVLIRISWAEGGQPKSVELEKSYAETAGDTETEALSGI